MTKLKHVSMDFKSGHINKSDGLILVTVVLNKLPTEIRQNLARIHKLTNWSFDSLRNAIYVDINVLKQAKTRETSK